MLYLPPNEIRENEDKLKVCLFCGAINDKRNIKCISCHEEEFTTDHEEFLDSLKTVVEVFEDSEEVIELSYLCYMNKE